VRGVTIWQKGRLEGAIFEGEFRNNKTYGYGTFDTAKGSDYNANWLNN